MRSCVFGSQCSNLFAFVTDTETILLLLYLCTGIKSVIRALCGLILTLYLHMTFVEAESLGSVFNPVCIRY